MKSLLEKVNLLQDFLEYISLRSFSTAIDELESRIRDTAYKMENTIELVIMPEPRMNCCVQFFYYFIYKFERIDVQLPTPDEFSTYFEVVHVLLEEAMEMKKTLDNNVIPLSLHPTSSRETTGSKEGTKVGLDKALNEILDQVTRQGSKLRIVPITGMGGIGKTTLARASFEAPQTLHHFDVRFWVTVSQDYNVQDILRGLLPEAERTTHRDEQLIEHVHKNLKGWRYLIVLDDMWDEKVWDRVRNAFPDDNKGSRVILTTRLSGVASYVGSSSPVHEMQFLSENQSWDLIRENVYGHDCCSTEFEDIGRIIARNCKGLPLAVVVIAGLLKFDQTRDYWEEIARNTNQKAITRDDHLFEILCWSYTRLPPHLKACFLYMGVYKEDYEIPTKELVMLWAAEGFLKPKQSKSMEEVAEECLEELVERSLVLVTKRWYHNGKIRTCRVHDVIREVSMRKAEEEKFNYHLEEPDTMDESTFMSVLAVQRRVSFTDNIFVNFPRALFFLTTHSLIDNSEHDYGYPEFSSKMVQRFKLLRVLTGVFPKNGDSMLNILTLTNLRYLHLYFDYVYNTPITIPVYISNLQNLETLIVSPPYFNGRSVILPLEIWKLQRLRHIIVTRRTCFLVPLPNQGCPSLQTLYCEMTINFTNSFAQKIPNVRKLKLKYTFYRKNTMENLQYLHQLEELSILCHFRHAYHGPLSTNFVFPQNLKKLSLYDTNFPMENLSPIGLLPNLKVLKLKWKSVIGKKWKPIEGEFLQLEHLKMEFLDIYHWRAESIHFPRLRKLVIVSRWLKEVPESIGEIDTLEMLIVKVKREAKRSVQKIKENQQNIGNDLLQVIISDYPFWN